MPPTTLNSEEPLIRGGLICLCLVSLGLVAVARRIGSVVGLAVGGVVLRLGVSVRALAGILVGLVRSAASLRGGRRSQVGSQRWRVLVQGD